MIIRNFLASSDLFQSIAIISATKISRFIFLTLPHAYWKMLDFNIPNTEENRVVTENDQKACLNY